MTQSEFLIFQQRQSDLKQFIQALTGVINSPTDQETKKLAENKIKELIPYISLDPEKKMIKTIN